jgi:hypothetical protein
MYCFKARILSRVEGIKRCPPKPGFTDMSKTMCSSGKISSKTYSGVAGFNTTLARTPASLMA